MDIGDTLAPKSQQLDAIDLDETGRVFTITGVKVLADPEQPVHIALEEFDRLWKPNKNTRRVLTAAWGRKSSEYVGRRVHLVRDPEVKWGGKKVGGVRIAALSDIAGPVTAPQMDGTNATTVTVQPLTEPATHKPTSKQPTPEQIAAAADTAQLRAWWQAGDDTVKAAVTARKAQLDGEQGVL